MKRDITGLVLHQTLIFLAEKLDDLLVHRVLRNLRHRKGMHTRSNSAQYDKTMCFFCQCNDKRSVHACRSGNVGKQIHDIVHYSNNSDWKVNYANVITENDALSYDIVYHKQCLSSEWRNLVCTIGGDQHPSSNIPTSSTMNDDETTVHYIAAEIEFFAEIQERIEEGEYIPMDEAEQNYVSKMKQHNIPYVSTYSNAKSERRLLQKKIEENVSLVQFTSPQQNKPTLIHSKAAQSTAMREAMNRSHPHEDMKKVFEASMVVRKAIERFKQSPWVFTGSLENCADAGIPHELHNMILWILKGVHTVKSESRVQDLNRSASIFSQQIVQAHKSNRQVLYDPKSTDSAAFHSSVETPITLGMSLYCDHEWRSHKLACLLSQTGLGVPYQRVKQCITQIAEGVQQNMEKHDGNYVPPGLHRKGQLRFSLDNIDATVDTSDGRNSFHATAMAVYQRGPTIEDSSCDTVAGPVVPTSNKSSMSLKDVPSTVIPLIPSTISGSPKPPTSPHYKDYKLGCNEKELLKSEQHDLAWLLVRHYNRDASIPASQTPGQSQSLIAKNSDYAQPQPVPVWAAYNSSLSESSSTKDDHHLDKVHALPLINSPAHEWTTLTTALVQLCKLNKIVNQPDNSEPILVWLDMDLYKRVRKISFLDQQFDGKVIPSPAQFHIVLCALRCLGATLESSGLDEAWVKAGLYSSITVMQILNGKHYNRAVNAHQITLQVLFDLWIDTFFEHNPVLHHKIMAKIENVRDACRNGLNVAQAHNELVRLLEELKLNEQLEEFDKNNDKYPMYTWARTYMRQVGNLLDFIRATRNRDWALHLASLEKMCIYFFAFNRHDYAQHIPEYLAHMDQIQTSHPHIWQEFENGEFAINTNAIPFTSIGIDQAQEHVNKVHKGDGAICGITTDPQALLKYCLSSPELARLAGETEHMLNITDKGTRKHHQNSPAKNAHQEQAIKQLKEIVAQANPFNTSENEDGSEMQLVNLITKQIMPEKVKDDILNMEARGSKALTTFVEERIDSDKNMWDKMPKLKCLSWSNGCKAVTLKSSSDVISLKATNSLFVRLLLIAKSSREVDLEEIVGQHEFSHINSTLMKPDGSLLPSSSKSSLIHELKSLVSDTSMSESSEILNHSRSHEQHQLSPVSTSIKIDGMALVQEMAAYKANIQTCKDLSDFFVRSVDYKSREYCETYIMFDDYHSTNSLKDQTRQHRTAGRAHDRGYKVDDTTRIRDFKTFLSSKETKANLVLYLANNAVKLCNLPITTHTHKGVQSSRPDMVNIVCNQEEADTLIILYAVAVSGLGKVVDIYSGDTDVLVLALHRVPELSQHSAIIMGTGDQRGKIKLKPIYDALGPERAAALSGFHALTGADNTGHIQGKGKPTCFKAFLRAGKDVISAIGELGVGVQPSSSVLSGCEKFLCQIFNPNISTARALRWQMFKQLKSNQGVEKLFPTQGAIIEHILRAHLQTNIWLQDTIAEPEVLDPGTLGWYHQDDGSYMPVVSKIPPAPEAVIELVKCNCVVSKCNLRCSCKTHNLACTELCKCEGADESCKNIVTGDVLRDEDDDFEGETSD